MESRRPPHSRGPLAQLVEQETLNLLVVGSIPTRPTNSKTYARFAMSPGSTSKNKHIVSDAPRHHALTVLAIMRLVAIMDLCIYDCGPLQRCKGPVSNSNL